MIRIFLYSISLMFLFGCKPDQEHFFSPYELSQKEKGKLKEGDIILRYGKGLASDLIVNVLAEEKEVSHCGILCKKEKREGFRVIHSVSSSLSEADGMQVQDLDEFISQSVDSTVMVVRYSADSSTIRKRIAKRAEHYLSAGIPFDHSFDPKDSTAFYCTELVDRAIADVSDKSILEGFLNRPYGFLHFDLFWKSDDFKVIIDHH